MAAAILNGLKRLGMRFTLGGMQVVHHDVEPPDRGVEAGLQGTDLLVVLTARVGELGRDLRRFHGVHAVLVAPLQLHMIFSRLANSLKFASEARIIEPVTLAATMYAWMLFIAT